MQQIILQPRTPDELRLAKQFVKVMRIKTSVVKETPKQRKKREILDSLESSVQDMNAYVSGKKRFKTAQEVLDEL